MTSTPDFAPDYLTGKILIASPLIGDPRFDRSIVLMCAHEDDHAMGIVVNKPLGDLRLPTLFEQLGIASEIEVPDREVLFGGPVDRDRGFVLHTTDAGCGPGSLVIADRIALRSSRAPVVYGSRPSGYADRDRPQHSRCPQSQISRICAWG